MINVIELAKIEREHDFRDPLELLKNLMLLWDTKSM